MTTPFIILLGLIRTRPPTTILVHLCRFVSRSLLLSQQSFLRCRRGSRSAGRTCTAVWQIRIARPAAQSLVLQMKAGRQTAPPARKDAIATPVTTPFNTLLQLLAVALVGIFTAFLLNYTTYQPASRIVRTVPRRRQLICCGRYRHCRPCAGLTPLLPS